MEDQDQEALLGGQVQSQEQEALLGGQALSNAYRILSKITQVHGTEFEYPYQDSKVAQFTQEHGKLFQSLGKLEEDDIQKLETDIEAAKDILTDSELCETLKEICFYFSGICAGVKVLENTKNLQTQMKVVLKLLNKAAGENKELKELYRLWIVQELARRLRRKLQNSLALNIFVKVVITTVSSTLVGLLTNAVFDLWKLASEAHLPAWVLGLALLASVIVVGLAMGHAFMVGLDIIADSS